MSKKIILVYVVLVIIFIILLSRLPYIIHYNYGNDLYKEGSYIYAIEEYEKALELFPSKYKECSIRINLALAMLKTMNEYDTVDNKLSLLYSARDVICEDGCANEKDDNGHSAQAEKLKKDIDKEIEKLKKQQQVNNDDDDDNKNKDDNKDNNKDDNKTEKKKTKEEKEMEEKLEKLEEIQNQSFEERQSDMNYTNYLYSNYEYYYGKTW